MARKKSKPYWEMTASELARATREFDAEVPPSRTKPLSAKERLLWERATGKPKSAPRAKRRGTAAVKLELDSHLVRQSADYAAKHNMTLSEFVAKSLKGSLIVVG